MPYRETHRGTGILDLNASLPSQTSRQDGSQGSHAQLTTGPWMTTQRDRRNPWGRPTYSNARVPEGELAVFIPKEGTFCRERLHKTIKITLTGPGWVNVRKEEAFMRLMENNIDLNLITAAWKSSERRYLFITFSQVEEAQKAAKIHQLEFESGAIGQIAGRKSILSCKIHWAPSFISDAMLIEFMQCFGEVIGFRRCTEKNDFTGKELETGTREVKLKVKPGEDIHIPTLLDLPIAELKETFRLLIIIQGRPQKCTYCWGTGHTEPICELKRQERTRGTTLRHRPSDAQPPQPPQPAQPATSAENPTAREQPSEALAPPTSSRPESAVEKQDSNTVQDSDETASKETIYTPPTTSTH